MALNIPSFPDPRDPAHPLTNVYGWLSFLALDLTGGAGRQVISVHPNEAAWRAAPIAQVGLALGQVLVPAAPGDPSANPPVPPTPEVRIKTLEELMADPEFAQAYATIGAKLYAEALKYPGFAGAIQV